MRTVRPRQERLRELCTERGMMRPESINQQSLAEALDVHLASANRLVHGRTGTSPGIIASALAYFGVPFEDLFEVVDDEAATQVTDQVPAPEAVAS